jgi:hypothetical protein
LIESEKSSDYAPHNRLEMRTSIRDDLEGANQFQYSRAFHNHKIQMICTVFGIVSPGQNGVFQLKITTEKSSSRRMAFIFTYQEVLSNAARTKHRPFMVGFQPAEIFGQSSHNRCEQTHSFCHRV